MSQILPYETGSTVPNVLTTDSQACRTLGVSEQSYYRWRKEYGGLRTDQAKRLKDLEKENGRLRKAISDLTLDKLILKEALEGNC